MQSLGEAGISTVCLGVTAESSINAGFAEVVRKVGRIDVRGNDAGYGSHGAIQDIPMYVGRRQFEVNVFGAKRVAQLVMPLMRERTSGTIVHISSVSSCMAGPLRTWNHGTKFVLEAVSDRLRVEVKSFGIDVVVIEPNASRTEFAKVAVEALRAASGSGPYGPVTKAIIKSMANEDLERRKSPPTATADAIRRPVIAR